MVHSIALKLGIYITDYHQVHPTDFDECRVYSFSLIYIYFTGVDKIDLMHYSLGIKLLKVF